MASYPEDIDATIFPYGGMVFDEELLSLSSVAYFAEAAWEVARYRQDGHTDQVARYIQDGPNDPDGPDDQDGPDGQDGPDDQDGPDLPLSDGPDDQDEGSVDTDDADRHAYEEEPSVEEREVLASVEEMGRLLSAAPGILGARQVDAPTATPEVAREARAWARHNGPTDTRLRLEAQRNARVAAWNATSAIARASRSETEDEAVERGAVAETVLLRAAIQRARGVSRSEKLLATATRMEEIAEVTVLLALVALRRAERAEVILNTERVRGVELTGGGRGGSYQLRAERAERRAARPQEPVAVGRAAIAETMSLRAKIGRAQTVPVASFLLRMADKVEGVAGLTVLQAEASLRRAQGEAAALAAPSSPSPSSPSPSSPSPSSTTTRYITTTTALNDVYANIINASAVVGGTPVRPARSAQGLGFGNVPNRPRMPPPVPMPMPQPVLLANSVGSFYMGQPTQPPMPASRRQNSRPGWTEQPTQPTQPRSPRSPAMKENLRTLMALVDAAGEGMKNGEVLSEGCWLEMCDTLKILYAQVDT